MLFKLQIPRTNFGLGVAETFIRRRSVKQRSFDIMDISNENGPSLLSKRFGRPQTGKNFRPQIHPVKITHIGQFHIRRNLGHSQGKEYGEIQEWYEPALCKYHGSSSKLRILRSNEGKLLYKCAILHYYPVLKNVYLC